MRAGSSNSPLLTIALTGNIAAGKSTVAELFRRLGATVIDADQLVREAQAPGSPVFEAIRARFGPSVIGADGALDRPTLRRMVMADPAAREALNAIVHPEVERRRLTRLAEARDRGDAVVVCDIPLLFEVHRPELFDAVVLVDAPEPVRLARLLARPGLGEDEARAMMAAQMPSRAKRAWRGPDGRSVFVIENDGDLATLERRARTVYEEIVRP